MSEFFKWNGRQTDSTGRRSDGTSRGTPKHNGNKGVMAGRREAKRHEAEERQSQPMEESRYGRRRQGRVYP